MSDEDTVLLRFMIEIYIQGHEQTITFPWALSVNSSVENIAGVMDIAHATVDNWIGIAHRSTIVDDRYNHHIIQWDKVAAVSILAPDAASLPWSKENEDG